MKVIFVLDCQHKLQTSLAVMVDRQELHTMKKIVRRHTSPATYTMIKYSKYMGITVILCTGRDRI